MAGRGAVLNVVNTLPQRSEIPARWGAAVPTKWKTGCGIVIGPSQIDSPHHPIKKSETHGSHRPLVDPHRQSHRSKLVSS